MLLAAEQQHASLQAAGRAVIASLPPHEQLGVPQQPGVDPLQPGVARHSPTHQYSGAVQPHSHATVNAAAAPVPVSEAGATAPDTMQQEMAALRKELEEERALRKSSHTRVRLGETGQRLIRRLVAGQGKPRSVRSRRCSATSASSRRPPPRPPSAGLARPNAGQRRRKSGSHGRSPRSRPSPSAPRRPQVGGALPRGKMPVRARASSPRTRRGRGPTRHAREARRKAGLASTGGSSSARRCSEVSWPTGPRTSADLALRK